MTTPDPVEPIGASDRLIVKGAHKRFGGVIAVEDVSLSVDVGRVHGLIGPNGAGKSTLLALISGFLRPDAGEIRFGRHDLTRRRPSAIAGLGIGRTFQKAKPLVGLNALENVMVGMHLKHEVGVLASLLRTGGMRRQERVEAERARRSLERFELSAEADVDAGDLTFGKLRFLEIARAVVVQPRLLLLDEPAAGLNRVESARLTAIIADLRKSGMGVLLVDHDVPFVFGVCDEITVMNFGRVIASGPSADVYRDPAVREDSLSSIGRSVS